ncbi:transposase, partial [Clostridiaceae bacterium HSG29]|nr:transposase [Clostridiaceae bacterium HSG29]
MKNTKKRIKTPTYILTVKLKTNAYEEAILNKRFEIGRKLYNAVLGLALKRYNSLSERKEYRKLKKTIIETNKKIKNTKDKNKIKELKIEQNKLYKEIKTLYKEFNLTEYGLIKTMTPLYKPFNKNIDNKTAQAIASRAWKAIDKLINGNSKKVYFKKYNELNSLEGKWNKSGMKYDGQGNVKWNKLKIPVIIKNTDTYAQKAIKDRVKYIRIIRKTIRGKNKYYVQIILEGIPPNKNRNKKETGTVGIDIGTQTIAIVSDKQVKLLELAPEVNVIYKKEKILQRKLDRQRR